MRGGPPMTTTYFICRLRSVPCLSYSLHVRRDVAEQVILKPIIDEVLSPAVISKLEAESMPISKR
jgi:hypothetical protein